MAITYKKRKGDEMSKDNVVVDEMPREKYKKYGINSLTDTDLVAILLRTGTKDINVQQLARCLLCGGEMLESDSTLVREHLKKQYSLLNLFKISYDELIKIPGIGSVKALEIVSLLEICKRITTMRYSENRITCTPKVVADYFMEMLRHEKNEKFIEVILDTKCRMMEFKIISEGSLTSSIVHPREVFKYAIQKSAHSIIVLHNHPSGDPTPSRDDISITKRLKETGDVVGIPLLDHIIIGDVSYFSLKEESYL